MVNEEGRIAQVTAALTASSTDLLRYFERRVGVDTAADLFAEAMVIAWRRVDSLPSDPERARMWLFGVARNVLLNAERGEVRKWRLADRLRSRLTLSGFEAPSADEGLEVRDAIARLELPLADLVRLVHWEGLTLVQAAEVLEISASTARGRYQRAKEQLRLSLGVSEAS